MEFRENRSRENAVSAVIQNKSLFSVHFSFFIYMRSSERPAINHKCEFMCQQLGCWHINKTLFPLVCAATFPPVLNKSFQKEVGG